MGILKRLFVKAPIEAVYLCDHCDEVLEDPLDLEPCGHTFCKLCIVSAPATLQAKCPVIGCGQRVTGHKKASRKYSTLLNELELKCPAEEGQGQGLDQGCTWRGQLGELDAHREDCEYNPDKTIACEQRGCGATFMRREKDNHNCLEYMREQLNKTQEKLEKTRKRVRDMYPDATLSSAEEEDEGPSKSTVSPRSSSNHRSKSKQKYRKPAATSCNGNGSSGDASTPEQSTSAAAAAALANGTTRTTMRANHNNNNDHDNQSNDNGPAHNLQIVYQTLPSTPNRGNGKGKRAKINEPTLPTQQFRFDFYQFDFSTMTKTTKFKTPLMAGYRYLSSTIRHENKFYSIGGTLNPETEAEVGTTIIFEEGTMKGVAGPLMNEKRKEFGLTVLENTIFAVGGCIGDSTMDCVEYLTLGAELLEWKNPEEGENAVGYLTKPRGVLSASALNGAIYAIGGVGKGNDSLASVEVYDPERRKWITNKRRLLTARGYHKSIVLGSRIYAVGGRDQGGRATSSVEWYDPREGRWTAGVSMNEPRMEFGLVSNNNGLIYAIGGSQTQAPHFRAGDDPTVEYYDERADKWELMDYPDNLDKNVDWMSLC